MFGVGAAHEGVPVRVGGVSRFLEFEWVDLGGLERGRISSKEGRSADFWPPGELEQREERRKSIASDSCCEKNKVASCHLRPRTRSGASKGQPTADSQQP
ncbi:hypothetical protein OPV22_024495 [Ensete ventricosum]|uniref:Uncharacterized protein n=1 Tax=Ensete ventricosum TaxID=4639 RepID=A0AAV8Q577_ENSVE|nr:hypothetical protein OPV22_024495 [Ensete ventricosum]